MTNAEVLWFIQAVRNQALEFQKLRLAKQVWELPFKGEAMGHVNLCEIVHGYKITNDWIHIV
jgi:hypothetical protein